MAGGPDLLGATIAPRGRGRPKGSTNKRGKELNGFIAAKYGASAAQQSAALCMVTPAELRAAGGSMAKAVVAKAAGLVELVREAQHRRDDDFRQVIREEFERVLLDVRDVTAKEIRSAFDQALKRVKEAGAGFTLQQALDLMTKERQALMPYTDQRQPQAVDLTTKGGAPSVVIMGAAPMADLGSMGGPAEFAEVFDGFATEVSRLKSHAEPQAVDLPGLPPPGDTD